MIIIGVPSFTEFFLSPARTGCSRRLMDDQAEQRRGILAKILSGIPAGPLAVTLRGPGPVGRRPRRRSQLRTSRVP